MKSTRRQFIQAAGTLNFERRRPFGEAGFGCVRIRWAPPPRVLNKQSIAFFMHLEFGRTPRINATAHRDHWAPCYTQLLAGGGVRGGQIYRASDGIGAYVKDLPVTPDDYMATILHAFGYAPESAVYDQLNRPQRISLGTPVTALF